jgi:Domain of unknown function (DUF4375)
MVSIVPPGPSLGSRAITAARCGCGVARSGNLCGMAGTAWVRYEGLALRDWQSLSEPERLLVAFGELRAEVNNGGFDQYFFNSP